MSFVLAIGFAVCYGYIEQWAFRRWPHPKQVVGPLTWYHILVMGPLFVLIGAFTYWPLIPVLFVIEDIAFFLFHPTAKRGPESWVNFGLRGFWVKTMWIPWSYVLGVMLSGIFWSIKIIA